MNAQLHTTDTVFATVTSGGKTLARMTMSGFGSVSELIKSICNTLSGVAGLVTVELRNSTVGWLERRSLRLRVQNTQPVQLTLWGQAGIAIQN